ncbi:MAG: hypothetical protein E6I76_04180 [Chloroflexi bacterium]|nr:MAG: hypothetical protein E6I76_04180 [Chloroflexota bacterium]
MAITAAAATSAPAATRGRRRAPSDVHGATGGGGAAAAGAGSGAGCGAGTVGAGETQAAAAGVAAPGRRTQASRRAGSSGWGAGTVIPASGRRSAHSRSRSAWAESSAIRRR